MAIRGAVRTGTGLGLGVGLGTGAFLTGLFRNQILTITGYLLQEDGFFLLQEDGSFLTL